MGTVRVQFDRALALLQNTAYSFSLKVRGHPQDAEDTMQDVLLLKSAAPNPEAALLNTGTTEPTGHISQISDNRPREK